MCWGFGLWGWGREAGTRQSHQVNVLEPWVCSPGPNPEWVALLPGSPVVLELRMGSLGCSAYGNGHTPSPGCLPVGQELLVATERWRCWGLGQLLPCVASCGIPWRGAGTLLLSALGVVLSVMHQGDLGTTSTQVMLPQRCHFWQLCDPLCLSVAGRERIWEVNRPLRLHNQFCSQL